MTNIQESPVRALTENKPFLSANTKALWKKERSE